MLLRPLNDTDCLTAIHDQARAYAATPDARALAAQLVDVAELVALIRALDGRAATEPQEQE